VKSGLVEVLGVIRDGVHTGIILGSLRGCVRSGDVSLMIAGPVAVGASLISSVFWSRGFLRIFLSFGVSARRLLSGISWNASCFVFFGRSQIRL